MKAQNSAFRQIRIFSTVIIKKKNSNPLKAEWKNRCVRKAVKGFGLKITFFLCVRKCTDIFYKYKMLKKTYVHLK